MESDVSPGLVASAMILDTLSGRSPLYRFERFVSELDTELLLGEEVTAEKFNDDALGRQQPSTVTGAFEITFLSRHRLFTKSVVRPSCFGTGSVVAERMGLESS